MLFQEIFHSAKIWKMLSDVSKQQPTEKMTHFVKGYENYVSLFHSNHTYPSIASKRLKKLNKNQQLEDLWFMINHFASKSTTPSPTEVGSVGGLYARILSHLAHLESCVKINYYTGKNTTTDTIFTGDLKKQLNSSDWHAPAKDSTLEEAVAIIGSQMAKEKLELSEGGQSFVVKKVEEPDRPKNSNISSPLFPVTDLKSAIEAVIEIVYEGKYST